MSLEIVRARCWISGGVQGVGFRYFAERAARRHALCGFVRNLRDGRVEAAAEGERAAVEEFLAELRRGPAGAVVRGFDVQWERPEGGTGFAIR